MESMLVCGGGSAISGLGPRVLREVRGRVPASVTPQQLLPPDYMPSQTLRFATWMGGAVLAKVGLSPHPPPDCLQPACLSGHRLLLIDSVPRVADACNNPGCAEAQPIDSACQC